MSNDALPVLKPYKLVELFRSLENRKEGLKTGYEKLDQHIRIPNGAITIIAGKTAGGKTSFLLNLLVNMLRSGDKKLYFFSYEDAIDPLIVRIIMIMAAYIFDRDYKRNFQNYSNYLKKHNGRMKATEKNLEIERAITELDSYMSSDRLYFSDKPYDGKQLAKIIGRLAGEKMTGAVFIDYIQKIPFKESQNG